MLQERSIDEHYNQWGKCSGKREYLQSLRKPPPTLLVTVPTDSLTDLPPTGKAQVPIPECLSDLLLRNRALNGKNSSFTSSPTLTMWSKLKSPTISSADIVSDSMWREEHNTSAVFSPKSITPIYTGENTRHTEIEGYLKKKNTWPLVFKTIKAIKDKERLEEIKKMWWLNAMWDPGLNSKTEYGHNGKVGKCRRKKSIV